MSIDSLHAGKCVCFCRLFFFFVLFFLFLKYFFFYFFRIPSDDPDQAQHSVGRDLGPDCLQMLSADDPSG